MKNKIRYLKEEKIEAIKLKRLYGTKVASDKLGIKADTINSWDRQVRDGVLILEGFTKTPKEKLSIRDENRLLKYKLKEINKNYNKINKEKEFLKDAIIFFRKEPLEVNKNERIKFLLLKTDNGNNTKDINFYCRMLNISRQAFNKYLKNRNKTWKYNYLIELIKDVIKESEYNDKYGRKRMHQALVDKFPEQIIPSEQIVYRVMKKLNIKYKPKKFLYGITVEDKNAKKSNDLLKRNFYIDRPYTKLITDITEVKCLDNKIYISAIFDCFNLKILGISIQNNMNKNLVTDTLNVTYKKYPQIRGAIIHSDRGTQYTSKEYRLLINKYGLKQSMNSDRGRCHDNARCEAMWGRMKEELLYGRYDTKKMDYNLVKQLILNYYIKYWNDIRICSAIGGITPNKKEKLYYENLRKIA